MFKKTIIFTVLLFSLVVPANFLFISHTLGSTALFQDDFETGSDGWGTNSGTWAVVADGGSNQYKQSDNTGIGFAYPTNAGYSSWDNYSVQADVTIKTVNTAKVGYQASISARYLDNNNRYAFVLNADNGKLEIRKKISGTETSIVSKAYTINVGTKYTVKGVVDGSTLELWVNGVKELTTTDTSRTTGKISLNTYGTATEYDNVVVSTLDTAPPVYTAHFGTTHSHTSASGDASQTGNTAADQFAEAKAQGYEFYIVTDHSQYTNFTDSTWADTKTQADNFTDSSFVGLRGFEFSENDTPQGHMNIFNTPDYIRANTAGVDFPYMYDWLTNTQTSTPAYASFNHPGDTQYNNWDFLTPARRDKVTLLEVINGTAKDPNDANVIIGSLHYTGFINALDKGWRVSPVAGLDAHAIQAIQKPIYRTGLLTTSFTKEGVLDAIANRRTYATYDKNLNINYSVNGSIMGSILNNPTTLNFDIKVSDPDTSDANDKITKIEIITDGGALVTSKTFDAYSVTWNPTVTNSTGKKYYFLKVYTAGKTDGPTAYVAPVWTGL